jgi:hypothetical protein
MILSACSASSNQGFCAFIVGTGYPHNENVDTIIYPGQTVPAPSTDHRIVYAPCNDRNYLVNDGSVPDLGDLKTLMDAKTITGTDVQVALSAYWTLNENEDALKDWYAFQLKYKAVSSTAVSGDENSSTVGWNNMLRETFGPALRRALVEGMSLVNDKIWQNNDTEQKKILTDYMMNILDDKLRQIVGSSDLDLFCGNASSKWPDPTKPGVGEYHCAPISIVIDSVIKNPDQSNSSTEGSIGVSQMRVQIAEELYGPEAARCWIAYQDLVQACSGTCVFNFNGNPCTGEGSNSDQPAIVLPAPTPVPVPTATP